MNINRVQNIVSSIAHKVSAWAGSSVAIILAFLSILLFILGGFYFKFSELYQMVANTFMSGLSYLLLFVIQNSVNRDSIAIQIKLNELIRSKSQANNSIINVESLPDEELERIHQYYLKIAQEHRVKNKFVSQVD